MPEPAGLNDNTPHWWPAVSPTNQWGVQQMILWTAKPGRGTGPCGEPFQPGDTRQPREIFVAGISTWDDRGRFLISQLNPRRDRGQSRRILASSNDLPHGQARHSTRSVDPAYTTTAVSPSSRG